MMRLQEHEMVVELSIGDDRGGGGSTQRRSSIFTCNATFTIHYTVDTKWGCGGVHRKVVIIRYGRVSMRGRMTV